MTMYHCYGFKSLDCKDFDDAITKFSKRVAVKNYSGKNAFVRDLTQTGCDHDNNNEIIALSYSMFIGKQPAKQELPEIGHTVHLTIRKGL